MAAVDDLTELVERAAVVEKTALASKWKDVPDVQRLIRRTRKAALEQRQEVSLDTNPTRLSPRWAGLRQTYLDLGAQPALPGQEPSAQESPDDEDGDGVPRRLSHQAAAQAEQDAVAAVGVARLALTDAALAVLQARLARLQAGGEQPDVPAVEGHVPLHGSNAVSRHGPALAHGLTGEIQYVLTRKPRNTVRSLAIALALGLLYLGFLRVFKWDQTQQWLPYLGLWAISFVMGGAVCLNAMSFDAMRVRAALDSGARLWQLLVTKNLALICLVAPIGFLLSGLLAWRAGNLDAFFKACALMISLHRAVARGRQRAVRRGCPSATSRSCSGARTARLKQFADRLRGVLRDRLPGQHHAALAGARRPGGRRRGWGARSSPRLSSSSAASRMWILLTVVRGGAVPAAEDPPGAAEGARRLRGERRGPSVRRRTGRRTGRREGRREGRDLTRPYDHYGVVAPVNGAADGGPFDPLPSGHPGV